MILPEEKTGQTKTTTFLVNDGLLGKVGAPLLGFTSLLIACFLVGLSPRGFDITDESYYLLSIDLPEHFRQTVNFFGFAYNPFFELFGKNIVVFRIFNIFATVILASITTICIFKSQVFLKQNFKTYLWFIPSIAVLSFSVFNHWILTPNYNSLALQGALITTTGIFFSYAPSWQNWVLRSIVISIGLWVVLLAKPTSAFLLLLATVLILWAIGRLNWKTCFVVFGTISSLILATAGITSGGIIQLITRVQDGLTISQTLDPKYSFNNLLNIDLPISNSGTLYWFLLFLICWLLAISFNRRGTKSGSTFAIFLICIPIFLSIVEIFAPRHFMLFQSVPTYVVSLAIPTSLFLSVLISNKVKIKEVFSKKVLSGCLILFFPIFIAWGTNNNLWITATSGIVFSALGTVIIAADYYSGAELFKIVYFAAATFLTILLILFMSMFENPYRQISSVFNQNSTLILVNSNNSVLVSTEQKHYLNSIQQEAKKVHFLPGTPLIDLTGYSPGIAYIIGAIPPSQAWLLGGYPGSTYAAELALSKSECSILRSAWLLVEASSDRAITTDITKHFGMSFEENYTLVAQWKTAPGYGGMTKSGNQQLYAPVYSNSNNHQTCISSDLGTK